MAHTCHSRAKKGFALFKKENVQLINKAVTKLISQLQTQDYHEFSP
jgi:hypothetical protein